MPRFEVVWTEKVDFIAQVDANTAEEAVSLCINNMGDWEDMIERSIVCTDVEEVEP